MKSQPLFPFRAVDRPCGSSSKCLSLCAAVTKMFSETLKRTGKDCLALSNIQTETRMTCADKACTQIRRAEADSGKVPPTHMSKRVSSANDQRDDWQVRNVQCRTKIVRRISLDAWTDQSRIRVLVCVLSRIEKHAIIRNSVPP